MLSPLARTYFGMWLKETFRGPWLIAMLAAAILGTVVNFVGDKYPAWSALANRAAWQLPVGLFLAALVPAAVHASWKLYSDLHERFAKASDEAESLRQQLAVRTNYGALAARLSALRREASKGWRNQAPVDDEALAKWQPVVMPWFVEVKALLEAHEVPASDLAHFEVVDNTDIQKFNGAIKSDVRKMWVRLERVADLAKKYTDLARD